MPVTRAISSLANAKQLTGADSPQNPGSLVTYTYGPATSTAGQTTISLGFAVSTSNTSNFFLWVDGKLLSLGSSSDFTFTNVQSNGTSSTISLNQALAAGLNINAVYLGVLIPNASATSILTINATIAAIQTIVGSTGIIGTTSGGNAASGNVGELVSGNPSSAVTPGSSGLYTTLTSISLTAGDWDLEGVVSITLGSSTVATRLVGAISLSNNALDISSAGGISVLQVAFPSSSTPYLSLSRRRISISSTTTVYLVGQLTYSTLGTAMYSTDSFISARRVR